MEAPTKSPLAPNRFRNHQDSLPRLPVPPLQQTLRKYILAVEPLVDQEQLEKTRKIVQEFGKAGGLGETLQEKLKERAQTSVNWLYDMHVSASYLEHRARLPCLLDPVVVFPRLQFRGVKGQIKYAAKLISGVLDFKRILDGESFEVQMLGNRPLCMDQFYKIFSSCRVPGVDQDKIEHYSKSECPPRHIVVVKNNQYFALMVYDEVGIPFTVEEFEEQLSGIVETATERDVGIGLLTSDERRNWNRMMKILEQDQRNAYAMRMIESSLFIVCLDEETTISPGKSWEEDMFLRGLHGGGSDKNSANRWFDKTIQFIVCPDGGAALLFEHTVADGTTHSSLVDHVIEYCKMVPWQPTRSTTELPKPEKLAFNITPIIIEAVKSAAQGLNIEVEDAEISYLQFTDFGKDFLKSCVTSPDAFIQIAIQLTYMKMHGRTCATYESASLKRFQLGRTEAIRSCSNASKLYAETMLTRDNTVTTRRKKELMRAAILAHRNYIDDAITGQAIDRHLFGLSVVAQQMQKDVPDLFLDRTYQTANQFTLCTSQAPFKNDVVGAFGPVVRDGYGVCYTPKDEKVIFLISAHCSCKETDACRFGVCLKESLLSMRDLLLS